MNMFRNEPEGLGGLVGCAFRIFFFAAGMAIFLKALLAAAGFAK